MTTNKIKILKDGIHNSLLIIYKEYLAMGYDENAAKHYTSLALKQYLKEFSGNGTMEEDLKNVVDTLIKKRNTVDDESECAKIYSQVETLTKALEIIKEVNSNNVKR